MENEISFKDLCGFFIEFSKLIIGFSLLGIFLALGYLVVTPDKFEATAIIQMAKSSTQGSAEILNTNVEQPNLLMMRLRMPSIYSEQQVKACGLENEKVPSESIVEMLGLSLPKNNGDIIELKVKLTSKEKARDCALALFELIRESQNQLFKMQSDSAVGLISNYQGHQKKLANDANLSSELGKFGTGNYFDSVSNIVLLTSEISRLKYFIASFSQARLVAPIYVHDDPVFPKKYIVLGVGFFAGLFFGFIFASFRKISSNYRLA